MLKNIITITTLLFIFLLNIEANTLQLTQQEKQYLENHPIMFAHNEANWPPFNFTENGKATGYSIDYINLLASKVGVKVKFISGHTWSDYMKMLQTPKLNLIINISKSKERSKTIEFSDVFLSVENAIYVNIKHKKFDKLDQLKGYTIAMPKDFYAQKFIEEYYPFIKQVLVNDQLAALKLLSAAKVDATIGKKVVMDYIMQKNNIKNIHSTKYINDERLISHMRIGASKQDKILIEILKKAQKLVTKEEKNKLNFKWLGINDTTTTTIKLSNKEKKYLKTKKELHVCVNSNKMPLELVDSNIHKGLSSEYINIITKTINIPVNIVETKSRKDTIEKLKNNECDIASMLPQEAQEKNINYLYPYINTQILIASKTTNIYIDSLESHLDKTFVTKDGCFIYDTVKKSYPNLKLLKVDSLNIALNMVESGKAFACLEDSLALTYAIQKNHLGIISIVGKLDKNIKYSIATREDEKILSELIKHTLSNVNLSDKISFESKWLKFTDNILIDYAIIIKIVISFLIIIVILLFIHEKQKKLKNKIERLNKKLESKVKKEIALNKQKDETIFKQAKLVSMGEMVSNISHQWRQPLAEVNSVVMNLEKDFYNNKLNKESLENNLDKIERLTEYMSNTIDNFNNFFKSHKKKSHLLASEHINKVLNLFENSFRKTNININLSIQKDIFIEVYEGELSQVLIILLQNAKDAFIINNISSRFLCIDVYKNHNKLIISIKDNAGGIKDEILEKIFEPYFTTKPDTQGIGLGLYVSKQIIEKSMKGKLVVSSKEDTTTFTITLPIS